jgi:uncharacterized protein (DUF1697 family)
MTTCVALLRGINVGRARRIAMAELRALLEKLGHTRVRTLLNSGNAVFDARRGRTRALARTIEDAIQRELGHAVPVIVITARTLDAIVAANPLAQGGADPSRFLVAFAADADTLQGARALLAQRWAPEALAVGEDAAYLWCAGGIIGSRLMQAFTRVTGAATTTRNWTTVLKLQAAARASV